jgi:hypothetical protein
MAKTRITEQCWHGIVDTRDGANVEQGNRRGFFWKTRAGVEKKADWLNDFTKGAPYRAVTYSLIEVKDEEIDQQVQEVQ